MVRAASENTLAHEGKYGVFIYPGSFDPVTLGHLDIITRASCLCSRMFIAIGRNREKRTMFTVEERLDMLRDVITSYDSGGKYDLSNVEPVAFNGLLADFAKKCGASVIVKGLRAMSDFEYEFQMALLNKYLDERLETIFMMTNVEYTYLSSSAVKEIAVNGGCLDGLVPACVGARLNLKIAETREVNN
jgi:pantetheine-phosphate adenylyltransferase